jgi:hypothetical protein
VFSSAKFRLWKTTLSAVKNLLMFTHQHIASKWQSTRFSLTETFIMMVISFLSLLRLSSNQLIIFSFASTGGPTFPFEEYGPVVELGPRPWHYTPIPKKEGFACLPTGFPPFLHDDGNLDDVCVFEIDLVSFVSLYRQYSVLETYWFSRFRLAP